MGGRGDSEEEKKEKNTKKGPWGLLFGESCKKAKSFIRREKASSLDGKNQTKKLKDMGGDKSAGRRRH